MYSRSKAVTSQSKLRGGGDLSQVEFQARVTSEREFDVAVLRSTLTYVNLSEFTITPFARREPGGDLRRGPSTQEVGLDAINVFGWITPVLRERAALFAFDGQRLTWDPGCGTISRSDRDPVHAERFWGWILADESGGRLGRDAYSRAQKHAHTEMRGYATRGAEQLERDLSATIWPMVIEQRLVFKKGK